MTPQLSNETFHRFQEFIGATIGVRIRPGGRPLFESRLRDRLFALHLADFEQYLAALREGGSPEELQELVDVIVPSENAPLHEDEKPWRFLHSWLTERSTTTIRAWCGAVGNGSEAWALATLCDEYGVDADVLGTDVNATLVEAAASREFNGSASVGFAQHNLLHPLAEHGTFDLVLLRHVLDDFDLPTRQRVLTNVHSVMRRDGLLVLGANESLLEVDHAFRYLQPSLFVRTVTSPRTRTS